MLMMCVPADQAAVNTIHAESGDQFGTRVSNLVGSVSRRRWVPLMSTVVIAHPAFAQRLKTMCLPSGETCGVDSKAPSPPGGAGSRVIRVSPVPSGLIFHSV